MGDFINSTIADFLDDIAIKYKDNDAVVYVDRNLRYTYEEFNNVCKQAAKGLMELGIKKGDHVAIWATNYPEWLISQFATAKIGAVLVTVNTNYKIFELEYLLKQSDSTTLILIDEFKDSNYLEIINTLCPEIKNSQPGNLSNEKLPYLKNLIYIGSDNIPGMFNWNDIMKLGENITDDILYQRQRTLSPHDVINMQYTSGTTGFPKGVMLTHHNILNNGYYIGECMHFTHKDRLCIPVPFFHCFGCVLAVLACVTHGSTMVPVEYFRPADVLKSIEEEKCTAVHGVPTMFIFMLQYPDFSKYDLSSLRTGIMAGSPCPVNVMEQVINIMGAKEITIAYGQTECSPVITQTRVDVPMELRVSTVGTVLPHIQAKIVNPDTGKELAPNETGELCTKGYHVMKGYYNMEEATRQVIDEEGWLHTGDLASVDENGYYKICGRIKDMIIRGGENIYPREIEELLYTHSSIQDVQVIGVPDKNMGEELMAYIIIKDKFTLTKEEVKEFVLNNMARHKVPKYIEFIDKYPMTASGKIQKFKLKELAIKTLQLQEEINIETT